MISSLQRALCLFIAAALFPNLSISASCPNTLTPRNNIQTVAADGWTLSVVTVIDNPRSILFDGQGRLLVVARGTGVYVVELSDFGGNCLTEKSRTLLIGDNSVSHMTDGQRLSAFVTDT